MVDNKNNERMHSLFINRPLKKIIYSNMQMSRKFIYKFYLDKISKNMKILYAKNQSNYISFISIYDIWL